MRSTRTLVPTFEYTESMGEELSAGWAAFAYPSDFWPVLSCLNFPRIWELGWTTSNGVSRMRGDPHVRFGGGSGRPPPTRLEGLRN